MSAPLPEDMRRALKFYERHAPEELPAPEAWPPVEDVSPVAAPGSVAGSTERARISGATRLSFRKHLFAPDGGPRTPAVSNVLFADLDGDARLEALGCDMRYGLVFLFRPYAPEEPMRLVSQAAAPAHVAVTDLDGDGIADLLVADLGEFQPGDHRKGAALWLRGVPVQSAESSSPSSFPSSPPPRPSSSATSALAASAAASSTVSRRAVNFLPTVIGNLPRVADVEAADVDEDGRRDLVVAAFGWRRTGGLLWIRNEPGTNRPLVSGAGVGGAGSRAASSSSGTGGSGIGASGASGSGTGASEAGGSRSGGARTGGRDAPPAFVPRTLHARAGAIHAVPVDLNRDGHVDIVSVISQEHEAVVALLNDGRGRFEERNLYTAPHPNWGSSGIQVVDLDKDGDLDVLLSHGDMFDDFLVKPYHGVQWLENRGTFPFTPHTLCALPGVHRALAVDLDRDDDLDIVAVALMPEEVKEGKNLPSIVWLEQTSPGRFVRHTLERGTPRHATLDAADYDKDGDIDLLIGNMVGSAAAPAWVELWENLTPPSRPPR